ETLTAKDLTLGFGGNVIIDDINLEIPKGKVSVLIGANGCGKSTILRSLARLLKPMDGTIVLDGDNIAKMKTKEVAKKLAILPQPPITPAGLTVQELVKLGRHPYRGSTKKWSKKDDDAVERALDVTSMLSL